MPAQRGWHRCTAKVRIFTMFQTRFITLASLCLAMLISGCAAPGPWEHSDYYRDVPYAKGKIVESKSRSRFCALCVTGGKVESAFFSGWKRYDLDDVSKQAIELLGPIRDREAWQKLGTDYRGGHRFFTPIRIFLISVDPIVVVTSPWDYGDGTNARTSPQHSHYVTSENVSREVGKFLEIEERGSSRSLIALHYSTGLRMPIELRRTLPAVITQARVITADLDTTVAIPSGDAGAATVKLARYTLKFNRAADGKVLTSFERR